MPRPVAGRSPSPVARIVYRPRPSSSVAARCFALTYHPWADSPKHCAPTTFVHARPANPGGVLLGVAGARWYAGAICPPAHVLIMCSWGPPSDHVHEHAALAHNHLLTRVDRRRHGARRFSADGGHAPPERERDRALPPLTGRRSAHRRPLSSQHREKLSQSAPSHSQSTISDCKTVSAGTGTSLGIDLVEPPRLAM